MLIVKIKTDGLENRFANLTEGVHSVGSSINSDVVLLDGSIDPLHCYVSVSLKGVTVEMSPGSCGVLKRGSEQWIKLAGAGTAFQWAWGDTLDLGGTQIQMQGDMLRYPAPVPESADKTSRFHRTKLAGSAVVGLFAAILLLAQVVTAEIGPTKTALETGAAEVLGLEMADSAREAKPDSQDILAGLEARGITVVDFAPSGEGWTGKIWVATRDEQIRVEASLVALAAHFSPRIYLDERLAAAAELVIQSIAPDADIETISYGAIMLSGIAADSPKAEMLQNNLMADIPGIQAVTFDNRQQESLNMVGNKIVGTWAGEFPYVLLDGGRTVRPGEEIDKHAQLIQVQQETVVVGIGESQYEVKLR